MKREFFVIGMPDKELPLLHIDNDVTQKNEWKKRYFTKEEI